MIRYIKSIWWRIRDWAVGPSGWLIGDATSAEQRDLSRLDRLDGLSVDDREVELDEMERAAMDVDEDTDWIFGDGLDDEFEAELEQWERRRDS